MHPEIGDDDRHFLLSQEVRPQTISALGSCRRRRPGKVDYLRYRVSLLFTRMVLARCADVVSALVRYPGTNISVPSYYCTATVALSLSPQPPALTPLPSPSSMYCVCGFLLKRNSQSL